MGWGNCGEDSKGRPIGYNHEGICDHPGCDKKIDRGLSYACGDMHGGLEIGCEEYFCDKHRRNYVKTNYSNNPDEVPVCDGCYQELLDTGEWKEGEEEGCLVFVGNNR